MKERKKTGAFNRTEEFHLTCIHARAHTHTHKHTQTLTHTYTNTHTNTHTQKKTHTHILTTNIHSHSHKHACKHALHTPTPIHASARTHGVARYLNVGSVDGEGGGHPVVVVVLHQRSVLGDT